jgi:NAD(P)H-nitrite reductase large subunit
MGTMQWLVNRCVCMKCTFSQLQTLMQERNLHTLEEVVSEGLAGTKCQMCHIYIEKMIETGRTEFNTSEGTTSGRMCS